MQIDLGIPGARPRTEADMARVDRLTHLLGQKDQLMTEVRRHLRLNPKPHQDRVTLPDITDRFNHTRTKQRKPTVNSFVTGRNVHQWQTANDHDEPNPFIVQDLDIVTHKVPILRRKTQATDDPCTIKKFCSKLCRCTHIEPGKQCPQQPGTRESFSYQSKDEDTLNGCKVNAQLERLQVPNYPLPPSMMDYQKNYFTCISDRPLKEHFKHSEFSKMQRTAFFNNLMTGYIRDDVNRRKEQLKLDMCELKEISSELDVIKKTFKKFIDKSNEDSVTLVKDQLQAGHLREEVEAKLVSHKGILSEVKTDILKLEGQLSTLMLCRDLLLKLSPSAWRQEYDYQAGSFKTKRKWLHDLATFYESYCRYYPEPGKDFFMDEAMGIVFKEVETMGPPSIYFTESWQIAMVLRRKELDCINQLGDIMELERKIADVELLSKELGKYREAEMKMMSEKMVEGRAEFEYQEKRVIELEAEAQALVPSYLGTISCGDIALETFALVEELYTEIFGQEKQTPEPLQMMIAIEKAIRLQRESLMEIEPRNVRYFEKKIEAEERKKYKAATKAKRVYREVKSYVNAARAMNAPPPRRTRTWKIPVRRSKVPPLRKKKSRASLRRDDQCQHYQLSGILNKTDVEESIDKAINAFLGLPVRPSSAVEEGSSTAGHSSIMSYASTESLERAIYNKPEDWRQREMVSMSSDELSTADSKEDPLAIEIGYDSDEELIKQNYEKKRGMVATPPVMYDAKILDDRFMVEGDDVKVTGNTRIRLSREPRRTRKNNPLSWR